MKKTLFGIALLAASAGIALPAVAAEPSLHEVYQAAQSGRLDEAQRMMHEVLQAHPNSGKAHYVEAELLARQGRVKEAAAELGTAERLAPGLPFANAGAVASLKNELGERHSSGPAAPLQPLAGQPAASGFPWSMIAIGIALLAFIAWAARFMTRRGGTVLPAPAGPSAAPFGNAAAGYGPGYGAGGMAPAATPGMGSQILGGLATGAAIGAGVAAGEALVHHFTDSRKDDVADDVKRYSGFDSIPRLADSGQNDLGGEDFGIADTSSWDDSQGSDSDWN